MISPTAIDHTCLIVRSLAQTRQHWEELFGFSFRVKNLNEVIERLGSAGIDDYATGAVDFFAHNNYRWCEWRDPDGIRVECVEIIPSS